MYVHDEPKSQGVRNACKRARQLVELKWTPLRDTPCCYSIKTADGIRSVDGFFHPWRPMQGIIYSGVRKYEKYVGFNVSLETFMTAAANPDSVLYTRCLHGEGKNTSAYYGNVCSCLVSYAWDLPYMMPCARLPKHDGVEAVDTSDLNCLQLCDIVLNPAHVVIITDILRDAEGRICEIAISESTLPRCMTTRFKPEEFRQYYLAERKAAVYRYAHIDKVTYEPSPYVHLEGDPDIEPEEFPTLMTNFGNKANYLKGTDAVELTVFEDGWEAVEVTLPNGLTEKHAIVEGKTALKPDLPGFYSACCVKEGGRSHAVQWCVVDAEVETDKKIYKPGEMIRVSFRNAEANDRPVAYIIKCGKDLSRGRGTISAEEAAKGEFLLPQNDFMRTGEEVGVLVLFRNEYGQYASLRARFAVESDKCE